jgi:hypothetical protein
MKHVRKAALAASAFTCAALFSFGWSERGGISLSVESAQARVGRPLTPMSVAGVARRQNRRAAYGYGAGVVGAGLGAAAIGTAAAIGGAGYYAGTGYYGGPYYQGAGYYGGPVRRFLCGLWLPRARLRDAQRLGLSAGHHGQTGRRRDVSLPVAYWIWRKGRPV